MTTPHTHFVQALFDPASLAPVGLNDGAKRPAGRRFDVYRNNVAVSLTEALETGFPVVTKLIGQKNMKGLAGLFLRKYPPTSPLMMHYGAALPEFISELPQLSHLGYLADTARLELALRRSYHASDSNPMAADALAAIEPDELMNATVSFAPSMELLRSNWPVFDIWRFNTQESAPKPAASAQDILITRPEYDPAPHLLPPGGYAWITALQLGQTIEMALEAALAEYDQFDLTESLSRLLQGNALTALNLKDNHL